MQSKDLVIEELTRCLVLVRPVSMSEDMAAEWLTLAAREVLGFAEQRPNSFKTACARVRRECSYHGQIVPAILKGARYEWEKQGEPFKSQAQIEEEKRRKPSAIESARVAGLVEGAAKGCKL